MARFSISPRTPIWLCTALLILVALAVINGVILTAAAAQSGLPFLSSMPLQSYWEQVTALISCMLGVAIAFGTVLFLVAMSEPPDMRAFTRRRLAAAGWTGMFLTVLAIVSTAAVLALITYTDGFRRTGHGTVDTPGGLQLQGFATSVILCASVLLGLAMISRAILRSSETRLPGHWLLMTFFLSSFVLNLIALVGSIWIGWCHGSWWNLPPALSLLSSPLWVWPLLILLSAKVREIMVQYVGDVAINVRPNKLDRFEEVRAKIKEAARSVAAAVFTAYERGTAVDSNAMAVGGL